MATRLVSPFTGLVALLLLTHAAPEPAVLAQPAPPDDHPHRELQTEIAREPRGLSDGGCSTLIAGSGRGLPPGVRISLA